VFGSDDRLQRRAQRRRNRGADPIARGPQADRVDPVDLLGQEAFGRQAQQLMAETVVDPCVGQRREQRRTERIEGPGRRTAVHGLADRADDQLLAGFPAG